MSRFLRRLSPVLALFFLAPLVGEFFLGDFPIVAIFLVVLFAPMYGGAALLIREFTRRSGRGWPSMIVLGLAYGVFEEGLVTQSLFNPHYLDEDLLSAGYVPWLHTGLLWLVYVVSLHTFWSVSVPVAMVEEATPARRTKPWLGWKGRTVVAVLFVVGSFAAYNENVQLNHNFGATTAERLVTAAIVVVLIVVALLLPRRTEAARPELWLVSEEGVDPAGIDASTGGRSGIVSARHSGSRTGLQNSSIPGGQGSSAPADQRLSAPASQGRSALADQGGNAADEPRGGAAPNGWVTGAVALVGGLVFKAGLIMPTWPLGVAAFLVGPVIVLVPTAVWSRRAGWGPAQRLGVAGGTLLTYSWAAFTAHSADFVVDLISHVIYALGAIALLYWVARRMRPRRTEGVLSAS